MYHLSLQIRVVINEDAEKSPNIEMHANLNNIKIQEDIKGIKETIEALFLV